MYMINLSILILFLIIIIFMLFLNIIIMMIKKNNRNKMSPFECGFSSQSNARLPFSNQFFMITLMFLIFDVEIILILPSIFLMKNLYMNLSTMLMFFLILLISSLFIEWYYSMLNWIF